ncbi:MAG: hypothetical protein HGA45_12365 [Chloroflexales bacterium]|nr:hypothetical protein [Chloroflexales bacterium]
MSIEERLQDGCATPPGDNALMAAADGEADEATLAHLRSCPSCASRVAEIRAFQARLRLRLYRLYCPASDILVDYCQGFLDPYQRAAVTHHLGLCPHCAAELVLMERAAPLAEAFGYPAPSLVIMPLP